jgi:hypothetical protein
VSAAKFEGMARRAGLRCISQELVNWYSPRLSDCLSMFTPNGSRWSRPNRIRHNPDFIGEARRIRETGMPGDARFVLERGHIAKPAPIGQ